MAIPGPNRRFHRSALEPRRGGRRNPDLAAPPGARAPAVARVGAALRWDDGLGSEQRPLDGGRPDGVLGRCVLPVHDRVHPRAAVVPTGSVPDTIGDRASVHRGCGTAPLAPPARSRSTIRHRGAAAAVHASSARARAGVAAARTRRQHSNRCQRDQRHQRATQRSRPIGGGLLVACPTRMRVPPRWTGLCLWCRQDGRSPLPSRPCIDDGAPAA